MVSPSLVRTTISIWKIPVDENGNQCLPGESILHPCRVEDSHRTLIGDVPALAWCREWFEDNFLIIEDWRLSLYYTMV